MEEAGGHTFRSYVRGKVVDFSPENLRNVMRFRAQVQGAATDFEIRKEHDQQLDQVLADLCIPGATWKLSTGQLRVPIQLRRQELNPVARGWHGFSIHSLIPSSNRSEIPVIRAILIHCIMRAAEHDVVSAASLGKYEKNQAEYMAELRDIKGKQQELYENNDRFYNQVRQEQKEMVQEIQQIKSYQEILDVKKYQMSAVTMGSSGSGSSTQPPPPPPYELDQALMKIREQHATFTEICRQLKDWTRNASGRECYTVWAHQLANPNLVEMSSQKIVKQIYDNIDHKRPMLKGLLKSDLQPSDPTQPPSSSKDPKDPPSSSKDQKDPPK
ncbi:hypothetical protein PIB30_096970 [Stylosanthes scabra]|uniref:Putative plant transposon protein domain-containing protein n=1 Tax=Stylosanthes scabra TaxID=79078 RepID=A0ABU6ZUW2_9FABA|nr:hypothetical protein [Stylosanthes scabra]